MSNSALFQSKLVSIMEILVNSAVADICRLVDDGAAVLHFEISRSKSENEDLRLKLQLMQRELETVRRGRERSLTSVGIQCVDFSEPQELSITIKQEQQNGLQREREERTAGNNIIGGDWSLGLPEHSARTDRSDRTGLAKESTHNHGEFDTRHHSAKRNLAQVNSYQPERPTEGHYEVGGPKTVGQGLRKDSRSGSPFVKSHREESSLSLKSEDKPSCERVGKDDDKHPLEQQQQQHQQLPFSPSQPYADLRDKMAFPSEVEYELDDEVCNLGDQGSFISGHQTRPKQEQEGEGSGIRQAEHAPPPDVSPRCLYQAASDLTFALQAVAGGGMPAAGVAPPQSGPSAARPHVCPQCGRSFAHMHVLKRHLVVHSGLRPHACGFCGKRFSLRDSLRRHQRIHTGERPYGCQLCGKRFTQRTHLNIHLSVHTGIRPFTCAHCGRSFTQTHVLRRHMRVHAAEGLSFYQGDS
ncbi:zinc finger and SCAN domain-containing protein 12-like [Alosa sapidissima]|uniref:zinc finger and SCAN domain-containing protein 12-like n=1 Tax=Alosa sapidissima TaxID=34773 RepID=UPI001C089544|nr:zinc finger and SCAN domain-containing protein 12-like [Alosa sapidissima]